MEGLLSTGPTPSSFLSLSSKKGNIKVFHYILRYKQLKIWASCFWIQDERQLQPVNMSVFSVFLVCLYLCLSSLSDFAADHNKQANGGVYPRDAERAAFSTWLSNLQQQQKIKHTWYSQEKIQHT